jgi:hypothetical protein
MSKIYALGFAALFAIAGTTAPAFADNHHNHHNNHHNHHNHHHNHHNNGWDWNGGGIYFDFAPIVEEEPVYCVDRRGRLFVCAYD